MLVGAASVAGLLAAPSVASAYYVQFTDALAPRYDATQPDAVYGTDGLTLRVSRNGAPLEGTPAKYGNGIQLPDLKVGDVASLLSSQGTVVHSVTYDGRPALDPTSCAGATAISGLRTPGSAVYAYITHPGGPDGDYTPGPTGDHGAKMTYGHRQSDPGDRFTGTLRFPLIAGQIIETIAYRESGEDAVYTSIERTVPACPSAQPGPAIPSPAPTPGPAADRTAPTGTFGSTPKLPAKAKLDDLVKKGLAVAVTSSENATAVATLSLQTPPATGKGAAAKPKSKSKPKKQPKVEVIGTATAQALAGRPLELTVKAGKGAKSKLGKAAKTKGAKLLVNVTLTDASGNTTTLPTTSLSLPKK